MKMGVERGRKTRKNLELGICGEHGGEPRSIMFCHKIGLDYVMLPLPRAHHQAGGGPRGSEGQGQGDAREVVAHAPVFQARGPRNGTPRSFEGGRPLSALFP